jgi:hypothetical protein
MTASIFPTDRGSVKLRFRRYVAAAVNPDGAET